MYYPNLADCRPVSVGCLYIYCVEVRSIHVRIRFPGDLGSALAVFFDFLALLSFELTALLSEIADYVVLHPLPYHDSPTPTIRDCTFAPRHSHTPPKARANTLKVLLRAQPPPNPPMQDHNTTQNRLDTLLRDFEELRHRLVGYPCNQEFDYSALLPFLSYSANNVGDPFHDSNFRSNTHEMEREVIGFFADLMRLPQDQAWGYVTSGGTEGNMYGLYIAREMFPDGVFYFSQDTHYSVVKILRVLKARNIMIKSQDNGEVDYDDLRETIRINRDVPVIFMANIGTTMKGAVDDVSRVRKILADLAVTDHYIHADAALSGMILPFVDEPQPYGFDAGFDSVAISGHKMIGSPLPCGVALTRGDYVSRIARSIEYVGVLDTTLTGSRNALTPLMIWYALRQHGLDGFREIVAKCLAVAEYAVARFNDSGIPAWRNRNSVTVVFPKPSDDVVRKWQLAPYEDIAHLITMPHVTRATIDAVVDDCLKNESEQRTAG